MEVERVIKVQRRTCKSCHKTFDATLEYFYPSEKEGCEFTSQCIECVDGIELTASLNRRKSKKDDSCSYVGWNGIDEGFC